VVDLRRGRDGQSGEPACGGDPRLVDIRGWPGDVLAVVQPRVVLVEGFGAQEELLEGDLIKETGVGAT